ncbi:hypothetical protein HK099_002058, partial [Clydaea vesicula]
MSYAYSEEIEVNLLPLEDPTGINLMDSLYKNPRKAKTRSTKIEKQLANDEKENKLKGPIVLVLGPADSGKSTFIRQMRIQNLKNFTAEEKDFFDDLERIFSNTYTPTDQ